MRRRPGGLSALLTGVALSFGWAPTGDAQVAAPVPVPDLTQPPLPPDELSVGDRPHPDYDPAGVRVGSFQVRPSVRLGVLFDSNIYGLGSGAKSDIVTLIKPEVDVVSDWNNHALALHAEGGIDRYAKFDADDQNNLAVQMNGRVDIRRGQYLTLESGYQIQHEDRAAPDSEAAAEAAGGGSFARFPTEYVVETGGLSYVYSPRRIGLSVDATATSFQFSNEPTLNGGTAINSDRNRTELLLTPRVSYEMEPGFQAFVQGSGDIRAYQSAYDATPERYRRSSDGYSAAGGAKFDTGGPLRGTIYLGYAGQIYDDPRLPANHGLFLGADVLWNVTRLTSLSFAATRVIQETLIQGSSGVWSTEIEAKVEHELRRDLILTAGAGFSLDDYQGIARTDREYRASAGVRWTLSQNLGASLTATRQDRQSDVPGAAYTRNTVLLELKVSL